jgi:hypothetical protein
LAKRTIQVQGEEVRQCLVQWKGQSIEEATWGDAVMLTSQFPNFSLEDKAVISEGGIVSTETAEVDSSGSRGNIGPSESLINHEVGPREWKVYSRRSKKVTKN